MWKSLLEKKQNAFKLMKPTDNTENLPTQIPVLDKDPILGFFSFLYNSIIAKPSQVEMFKKRFENPQTKNNKNSTNNGFWNSICNNMEHRIL